MRIQLTVAAGIPVSASMDSSDWESGMHPHWCTLEPLHCSPQFAMCEDVLSCLRYSPCPWSAQREFAALFEVSHTCTGKWTRRFGLRSGNFFGMFQQETEVKIYHAPLLWQRKKWSALWHAVAGSAHKEINGIFVDKWAFNTHLICNFGCRKYEY